MGAPDKYVSILAHLRAFEGWLADRTVTRVVRVPNRLVNFVTFLG